MEGAEVESGFSSLLLSGLTASSTLLNELEVIAGLLSVVVPLPAADELDFVWCSAMKNK